MRIRYLLFSFLLVLLSPFAAFSPQMLQDIIEKKTKIL